MNKENLHKRILELSDRQRQLLKEKLEAIPQAEVKKSTAQLTAFVLSNDSVSASELRNHVSTQLPDYMVPANFVLLEEFPRLPNGKIDQKALAKPEIGIPEENTDFEAPTSEIEQTLAGIWEEILGFSPIGVHDNFFEIGGDSILSIQITAKIRQKGISLSANQLFTHPTIAELALVAGIEKTTSSVSEKVNETGRVGMTPIQHWFFEKHKKASHFWNQAILAKPAFQIAANTAQKAMEYLIERHDALRLSFKEEKAFIEESKNLTPFQTHKMSGEQSEIDELLINVQKEFSLSKPFLFQCIYLEKESEQNNDLLFVAHHLLTDSLSWNTFLNEFYSICEQLDQNSSISLPKIGNSFRTWTNHLQNIAETQQLTKEYEFWNNQTVDYPLPTDFEYQLPLSEEEIASVHSVLNILDTKDLLENTHAGYNTKVEDLLISAFVKTIQNWANANNVCLGLERHGRELTGKDAVNTVGWFTSYFPLKIELENTSDLSINIKSIKEQIRQIPNGGIGYGILRYLSNKDSRGFELNQQPPIVFNYLGNSNLGKAEFLTHHLRHPKSERHYLLEVNLLIKEKQLCIIWNYSEKVHKKDTIEKLANDFIQNLNGVIEHCKNHDNTEYTPSDFPEADLSQDDLDNLMNLF